MGYITGHRWIWLLTPRIWSSLGAVGDGSEGLGGLRENHTWCGAENQWEFQDPKMEVLYHIRPYFVGIFLT